METWSLVYLEQISVHQKDEIRRKKVFAMRLIVMPKGKNLGWSFTRFVGLATIDNNGKKIQGKIISVDEVRYAKLTSKFGDLTIGYNGKFGQWAFEETGGSVIVFWSEDHENKLYVAGGFEKRLLINEGEDLFTPPGGFGILGEAKEETAKRETWEETGIHVNSITEVGIATHNRAFWIKETDGQWPLTVFAVKVDWKNLIEKDGQKVFPNTEKSVAGIDKLSKLIFLPVMEAISSTADDIAVVAYAKTLAAWHKKLI
jgi:ADP-ribose pyrophosphatase YjhB (NUDIX family)